MKILFLATSTITVGETVVGLSLARQLAEYGVISYFIISEISESLLAKTKYPYVVIRSEMGRIVLNFIEKSINNIRPDIIILSDYFTYCNIFARQFSIDPWFIVKYNIPVVPIDYWDLGVSPFRIDVFGCEYLEIDKQILNMPCVLYPVPICYPNRENDKRSHYFPLLREFTAHSSGRSKNIRKTLGLSEQEKLILLSLSHWQIQGYQHRHVNRLVKGVPKLIAFYLSKLPNSTHILFVGGNKCELLYLPKTRIHYISIQEVADFEYLLLSIDLLLTLNLPSTALMRAALGGVNSLVLTNEHFLQSMHDVESFYGSQSTFPSLFMQTWIEDHLPLYPFRMWPMGWYDFLEPVLHNNPYLDTFNQAEILNEAAVKESLEHLLFDRNARSDLDKARETYMEKHRLLYHCGEILSKIAIELNICA